MELDLAWDPPLQARWGAPERLCGIRVFHDFEWLAVFPDERTHFKRGQVLARTVRDQCAAGLIPALLLTRRKDTQQGFLATSTHTLFVVNIDEWLRTPENAALSYVANHLPVDPTELGGFAQLSELGDPEKVRAFVERQMDVEQIAEWLGEDASRIQRLAQIVDLGSIRPSGVEHALDDLGALGAVNQDQLKKLIDFVVRLTDADQRAELFRGATQDEPGRRVAGLVLRERIEDRVADARVDLAAYKDLLENSKTTETDMQQFLAEHPLLFSLEYASIRPQTTGPSGAMDFLLERFDGYNDLIELKEDVPSSVELRWRPS